MFKRVEKRLKRKQREDELGIDDDMKQVLGLNDTDSDESESGTDSEEGSVDGEFEGIQDVESDEAAEEEEFDDNSDEGPDSDDEPERALLTIEEALSNPIFIVSLDPDIRECIVCPGKQLKGAKMIEAHTSSNAHERRFKQFKKLAASANPKANAQELLAKAMDERQSHPSAPSETSKRAEKKRIALEKRKAKREKFKARQRAKKEAQVKTSPTTTESKPEEKVKDKKEKVKKTKTVDKTKDAEAMEKHSNQSPEKAQPSKKIRKSESTPDTQKSKKRDTTEPSEPPKKKRKTATAALSTSTPSTVISSTVTSSTSTTKKSSAKPKPPPSQPTQDSPEVIQELQAQVKDIIKSASSLAKAARARALDGNDDQRKFPSVKKKKPKKAKAGLGAQQT